MSEGKSKHLPYIDGLRALAVTLVFIFHLNHEWLPGGYIGVDVFFVISGFVISLSLYKEFSKTGTINIGQFYLRRIKRLYPALVTMVSVTTVLYFFIGFLWNTNVLIKSAFTSLAAVSNFFYLKQTTEYFARELTNPFLHTWSLGIEEQFYFIYPITLFLVLYFGKRLKLVANHIGLLWLLAAALLFMIFASNTDSVWGNFYWPVARFWELLAGCALFFFFTKRDQYLPLTWSAGMAGVGCLLLTQVSTPFLDQLFVKTFLSVIAAASIIYAGFNGTGLLTKILSLSPVVYLGKISYSLYLWHLPVIYFLNFYTIGFWYTVGCVVLTFVLANLSYCYIENPLRYAGWFDRWLKRLGQVLLLIGLLIVGLSLLMGPRAVVKGVNNGVNTVSEWLKPLNYIESQHQLGERVQPSYSLTINGRVNDFVKGECGVGYDKNVYNEFGLRTECLKSNGADSLIYITGDSHSNHYLPMLDRTTLPTDIYFERFYRPAITDYFGPALKTDETFAKRSSQLEQVVQGYRNVFYITSLYLSTSATKADEIEVNLRKYIQSMPDGVTFIFVAPTPVWPTGPDTCVLLEVGCVLHKKDDEERRGVVLNIMQKLQTEFPDIYIYDPSDVICPAEECLIYDKEKDFLWYEDDDHLSNEGSVYLVPHFDAWMQEKFGERWQ